MTSVVDPYRGENPILVFEDVEAGVVLLDAPEVGIAQAEHGANQYLVHHLMGYQQNSLALVVGGDFSQSGHSSDAHLAQALTVEEFDPMGFLQPALVEVGMGLGDLVM